MINQEGGGLGSADAENGEEGLVFVSHSFAILYDSLYIALVLGCAACVRAAGIKSDGHRFG